MQAQLHSVDFVLLGGDLFHENKPSRPTFYRALRLLRRYVLGDKAVELELVSDGRRNFPGGTGRANWEDDNVNVALPVFSIHGNHDDPAGLGALSPMDLLHEARVLNYFGKAERVDSITNYPILLRKADAASPDTTTKLALYGLGNVRDERLHRTFASNGVRWVRPSDDSGDWFNLCVLHQNRVAHSVHDKNFITARMLPDFLDIVVWGHEHECIMDDASEEGEFVIVQPGSSVATSLSQGESVDKHVALVEIKGDNFRLMPIPLYTTRPFVIADVTLSEEVDAKDANPAAAAEEVLVAKVNEVLDRIAREPKFANPDRPKPPLVRLRVEHTGFARINVSRFGQRFVGRVANPDDLLQFYKQKAPLARRSGGGGAGKGLDLSALEAHRDVDEAPPISEIVAQLIARTPLSVLNENGLADAIEEFVDKKSPDVIQDFVKRDLKTVQADMKQEKDVMGKGGGLGTDEIERTVKKKHDERRDREGGGVRKRAVRAKKEGAADGQRDVLEDLDVGQLNLLGISKDSDDDDDGDEKEEKKGGRGKAVSSRASAARGAGRGRGRGRGGKASAASRQRSKVESKDEDDEDEEYKEPHDDFSDGGDAAGGDGLGGGGDFDEDEDAGWGRAPGSRANATPSPKARPSGRGRRQQAVDEPAEDHDEETQLDEDAVLPAPKRSRVKAEPRQTQLIGSRNKAGELSFLTGAAKKRAAPAAKAASSATGGGRGRGAVVDLSEDIDE